MADVFECADMAANLPRDGSSAIYRSINPDWRWTLEAHLAAIATDTLRTLLWTKSKDANRKPPRNRPEPIPRPGKDKGKERAKDRFEDVEGVPKEEFMRWMRQMGVKKAV